MAKRKVKKQRVNWKRNFQELNRDFTKLQEHWYALEKERDEYAESRMVLSSKLKIAYALLDGKRKEDSISVSELRDLLPMLRNFLYEWARIHGVDRTVSQMSIEKWRGADDGK